MRAPVDERSGAGGRITRIVLALLVLVVFARALAFPFLAWDDDINVTENPAITSGGVESLVRIWSEPYAGLYAPLAYTWFWLLARLSELFSGHALNAGIFHAGSLLLHALNVGLVWKLLCVLVRSPHAACVGAVLFAVHPLQAESVAWVTEGRGLLSSAFALVALERFLAAEPEHATRRRDWTIATVAFVLALLAKPQAVALPLVAAILAVCVLQRPWRAIMPVLGVWIVLGATVALLTKSQQSGELVRNTVGFERRPLIALDALGFYLSKVFVPIGLAADYGRTPIRVLADGWSGLMSLAPVCALLACLPGRRVWLAALGIFVCALAPVLGLVAFVHQDISTVADRYAYLALLGPALAAAQLVARVRPAVVLGVAAALALLLGTLSWHQTGFWRDESTLFTRALVINPQSYKAWSQRGLMALRAGKKLEAEAHYTRSLELEPAHAVAHQNLGSLLCQRGELELGIDHLRRALERGRASAATRHALGTALVLRGEPESALIELRRALELEPTRKGVRATLGSVLLALGDSAAAAPVLRAALLEGDNALVRKNLAQALLEIGEVAESEAMLRAGIRVFPKQIELQVALVWQLVTQAEGRPEQLGEALGVAEEAVQRSARQDAGALDALALVQAHQERFTEARANAVAALALARVLDPELAARIELRVKLYERGAVYRGRQR